MIRRIGIRQIAKLADVSIGTVDRALHGRPGVSEATRNRIVQIAKRADYSPNLAARSLSVGRATLRLGVCVPRTARQFYDQVRDGIMDEARHLEHLGIEVLYRPVDRFGSEELETMEQMMASDVQAIIIIPADPQAMTPLINEAEGKGIRVICAVSDAPNSSRSATVCADPVVCASLAAELMARFVPAGSSMAIVTGVLQVEDQRNKTQAFTERFRHFCPEGKIVRVIEGHENDEETFRKCLNLLDEESSLAGIYVNLAFGVSVAHALTARGRAGKVALITSDIFPEMVPYIENGTIAASIYQRPYVQGVTAIRLIVNHMLRSRPIPPTHYLNPAVVMRSNLYLFRETRQLTNPPGHSSHI